MTIQQTTTVALDPVKDYEIVRQYDNDPGWVKVGEGTVVVVYELRSNGLYLTEGFYLPSDQMKEKLQGED